jgi:hypothetical protein
MIDKALFNLKPGTRWNLNGENYSDLEWLDTTQTKPTEKQVMDEVARLQALYEATEYQRQRAKEYPPLTDLADALYHQQNGDETKMTAYLAKCEAVKQKYPKE